MKESAYSVLAALYALILVGCRSALLTYGDTDLPAEKKTAESVPYYLPKGKIETDCAWNKDSNTFVFTVIPLIEPQRGAPLWMKRDANPFFDDTMTLSVNSKGLLQTANVTTQDQTAATLAALISAAGSAMSFGAGIAPTQKAASRPCLREPNKDAVLPSVFQHIFDPEKPSTTTGEYWVEIPGAPNNLRHAMLFTVSTHCVGTAQPMTVATPNAEHPLNGVVVCLPIPYRVSIQQAMSVTRPLPPKGEGGKEPTEKQMEEFKKVDCWTDTGVAASKAKEVVLVIPNKQHKYVLPLSRVPAVSRETDVALVDGTLQTLTLKRPSLVLGIASIPQTILTALVPIPLSIRQSAANNVQAVDTRLKAEADIRNLQRQ